MLHTALGAGRRHGSEFVLFAGSTAIYQGARFAFSLGAAHVLAPAALTGWALIFALLAYAPAATFGVANGMNRELPTLIGAGRETDAVRVESTGWTVSLVVAAALAALAVAGSLILGAGWMLAAGVLAAGAVVYQAQQFTLRSRLRFGAASLQQAASGVAILAGSVTLVALQTADLALVVGVYAIALVVGIAVGGAARLPRLHFDLGQARSLARIGFPMMLAGLAFSVLVTLDRWIGVALLGPVVAAPYALAALVAASMLVVPAVVSQQVYPRMAIAHGQGSDDTTLRRMAWQQGVGAAALSTPLALAVTLFAILGVPRFLPLYVDGIPAIVILSISLVVLTLWTGYGNYLNVTNGQALYLRAQLAALALGLVVMTVGGLVAGITGIAGAVALTHIFYGVLLRLAAARHAHGLSTPRDAAAT